MRAAHCLRRGLAMLALSLIPLAATACGTLDVSFERPAGPDESGTSGRLTRSPERVGIPTPTPAAPLPELIYRTEDGIWKAGVTGQAVQILDHAEYGGHTALAISRDSACALYLKEDAGDLDVWLADLTHGVGSIAVTPDGDVWGDGREHRIVRYDGETGRHTDAVRLPTSRSRRLVVGPDGVLWAVGHESLAYQEGDRWAVHEAGVGGGPLDFGPDGTLWPGTSDGVLHLHA